MSILYVLYFMLNNNNDNESKNKLSTGARVMEIDEDF